jgi:hypothetical protein
LGQENRNARTRNAGQIGHRWRRQAQGERRRRVVEKTDGPTLARFVRETVSTKVSLLCTDTFPAYNRLKHSFPHQTVDHSAGQHVVGAVHTNTIEGFWSLIKRGIMGSFHKVSHKYLPSYVAEFQFRYNNRLNADICGEAVKGC